MSEQHEAASVKVAGARSSVSGEQETSMDTQADAAVTQSEDSQRIPRWLQQSEKFLRVIVRIYLGLLVCLAPWYPPAWEANPLFLNSPGLVHWISSGAVRGVVSGLGLLNLWIALGDALRPLRNPAPGSGNERVG
jgi:hypothetical protein